MRLRSRKTAGDIAPKLHVTGIHVYSCVYLSIHVGTTAFFQITAHICATRAKFRFEFFDILVNIRAILFRPVASFIFRLYLPPARFLRHAGSFLCHAEKVREKVD